MVTNEEQLVIFTDLDGTLLDPVRYSWETAGAALRLIFKKSIPLIICSSKTRAEIEKIRKTLNIHDPFVSENGGGIFIPEDYFPFPFSYQKKDFPYLIIEMGIPYSRLRKAFGTIAQQTGETLVGFGDLSSKEIADQTGLSIEEARLAKQREYDEPFVFSGNDRQKQQALLLIKQQGLSWTHGTRFEHLTGPNDKGKAVEIITKLFKQKLGRLTTIALGDSLNDLSMLAAVDRPILVQRPDGSYDEAIALPNLELADGVGPAGWNRALLRILKGRPR